MPSRKKAKGKARRAAKEAKAAEEKEEEMVALTSYDGGSLETQMQRLTLTIDDLFTGKWRELGGLSKLLVDGLQCHHGLELLERHCEEFVEAFHDGYNSCCDAGENDIGSCFEAGFAATKAGGRFADIWKNVAMLRKATSIYVTLGTQFIIDGNEDSAREFASIVCYFELQISNKMNNKRFINIQENAELHCADINTLVNYFRRRIPCNCLDKKYKEVRSIIKIGLCASPECSHPGRKVERKKMLTCTG
jgi:hypothetical protein